MSTPLSPDELLQQVRVEFAAVAKRPWKCGQTTDPNASCAVENGTATIAEPLTIERELNLFRDMMFLMKFKHDQETMYSISENFTYLLMLDDGLRRLISATVDIDETSQHVTSLDQRFHAIGQVVAFAPKLPCSLGEYYANISRQIMALFTKSVYTLGQDNDKIFAVRRIGTAITNSLFSRNKKLGCQYFIQKLSESLRTPGQDLSITEAVDVIYSLVSCRFDLTHFVPLFARLFCLRCSFEGNTISHYKSLTEDILKEIVSKVKRSVHLIDDALFVKEKMPHFRVSTVEDTSDATGLVTVVSEPETEEDLDIKLVDRIAQVALLFISKLKSDVKVDLFLMLLERLAYVHLYTAKQNLILYSLIDSVQETVGESIIEYPSKCITFVVTLLNRSADDTSQFAVRVGSDNNQGNDEQIAALNAITIDSKTIALQILSIAITEPEKLSVDHIRSLKQCTRSLDVMIAKEVDSEEKKHMSDIRDKIISLREQDRTFSRKDESRFSGALRDLNDSLMPVRAHALVVLKNLIYEKDPETLRNQDQLVERLTISLSDPESYIYLSAINTFAALAVVDTHKMFPILANAFLNEQRTVQERVNVGEVIVQLSKRLGDMAPRYSEEVMNFLMLGLKSSEPTLRVSTLSNLGQFCAILRFSLQKYIVEIMAAITTLLKTDPYLDVKRASLMFMHMVLNSLDKNSIIAIQSELLTIYRTVKYAYETSLDDLMRLHAQLALEQLDRLAKEMLAPEIKMKSKIEMLP